jgi:hypothetical protein
VQAGFVVVDENAGADVHGIDETEAFLHPAAADEISNGIGNVDESTAGRNLEPKVFGQRFHGVIEPLREVRGKRERKTNLPAEEAVEHQEGTEAG